MPELPDVLAYCNALRYRVEGETLTRIKLFSPFVLRTTTPPLGEIHGLRCCGVKNLGKRIVLCFDSDYFLVIHLMIAGRLLWKDSQPAGVRPGGKLTQAMLEFEKGHLLLTEASTKKRAALSIVAGQSSLSEFDAGGLDPLHCSLFQFKSVLSSQNQTLKRALTNPSMLSGIGNAYSDEILHAAKLSPVKLTTKLKSEEFDALYDATKRVLSHWINLLNSRFSEHFPKQGEITAFRPEFAVHGKYGKPCPVCGKPVQRIRYVENETNYCAQCQNGGRILADRGFSRLLKDDWPRNIDDIE